MNKKSAKVILKELPEMKNSGIINEKTYSSIEKYCSKQISKNDNSLIITLIGAIAALLIGGGIILLIAHNWDQYPKALKLFFSFLPLLFGQTLLFFSFHKNKSSAWMEFSAIITTLSIAAVISLISQIYHISGNLERFMLVWILLITPMLFLIKSFGMILIYSGASLIWLFTAGDNSSIILPFWTFIGFQLYYYKFGINKDNINLKAIFQVFLIVGLTSGIISGIGNISEYFAYLYLPILSSFFIAYGEWYELKSHTLFKNPSKIIGYISAIIICYSYSFEDIWKVRNYFPQYFYEDISKASFINRINLIIPIILILITILIINKKFKTLKLQKNIIFTSYVILPLIATIIFVLLLKYNISIIAMITFNIFLFILGIITGTIGLEEESLLKINAGMIMITSVIITRFFDSDVSFAVKGTVFIILGTIFLGINYKLSKEFRLRDVEEKQ